MDWRESTKVTKLKTQPEKPRDSNTQISELVPGFECYLEDWQFNVVSVVSKTEMLLGSGQRLLWLEDYPTGDFVDDQKVRIIGPVKVTGSKAYVNAAGAEVKVRSIRLLDENEIAIMEKAAADAAEAKLYRKFTDSTGKHSFDGKFIEYKNSMVVILRRDNQKSVEIKMSQLSREDGDWLRSEMKARKERAETERKTRAKK